MQLALYFKIHMHKHTLPHSYTLSYEKLARVNKVRWKLKANRKLQSRKLRLL